jgi:hypothetical protein
VLRLVGLAGSIVEASPRFRDDVPTAGVLSENQPNRLALPRILGPVVNGFMGAGLLRVSRRAICRLVRNRFHCHFAGGLRLYTRNGEDFAASEDLLDIIVG